MKLRVNSHRSCLDILDVYIPSGMLMMAVQHQSDEGSAHYEEQSAQD